MSTAKIVYKGGLNNVATHLASGKSIETDAPVDNNGRGEAFSPTDLTATSLGACAMTVMSIAAEKAGHEFKGSEVSITKVMSADAPRRIVKVKVEFSLISEPVLSAEEKERYERVGRTCPVALSLHLDIEQEFIFNWQN
ncbi:OsmC family protein [Leadbetterella byssophila]|uniref:OsmC family protein n=1 Tax=Leadbetterella byssophila TaxID=316068 RepID=UPI00399F4116